MSGHLQRAILLLERSRHADAVGELRRHLAEDPNNSYAHALLALCLAEAEQFQEATQEAQTAIHLRPDFAFAHAALARVRDARHRPDEALAPIREALRLDPDEPDYFAHLASIHFQKSRWNDALTAAEQGLALDAEHVGCANLRAMALVKLGRKELAAAGIDSALAKNPQIGLTHANQGWTCLERGDHRQALEHFREALRLEPDMEYAREGIVTALKARNFLYRWMLGYFLYMSKLAPGVQWAIVIGGVVGIRMLNRAGAQMPSLQPFVLPISIAYLVFVVLTWIADPLFNLLLRLDRFGRLVLSPDQRMGSNLLAACLALCLACLAGGLWTDWESLLNGSLVFLLLSLPASAIHRCRSGPPRIIMALVAAALLTVGLVASLPAELLADDSRKWVEPVASGALGLFLLGIMATTFGANFLMAWTPRR